MSCQTHDHMRREQAVCRARDAVPLLGKLDCELAVTVYDVDHVVGQNAVAAHLQQGGMADHTKFLGAVSARPLTWVCW